MLRIKPQPSTVLRKNGTLFYLVLFAVAFLCGHFSSTTTHLFRAHTSESRDRDTRAPSSQKWLEVPGTIRLTHFNRNARSESDIDAEPRTHTDARISKSGNSNSRRIDLPVDGFQEQGFQERQAQHKRIAPQDGALPHRPSFSNRASSIFSRTSSVSDAMLQQPTQPPAPRADAVDTTNNNNNTTPVKQHQTFLESASRASEPILLRLADRVRASTQPLLTNSTAEIASTLISGGKPHRAHDIGTQTLESAPHQERSRAEHLNAMKIPGGLASIPRHEGHTDVHGPDFDWLAYLDYNSDVAAFHFTSETLVKRHFQWMGETEHRLHQRVPVVLRYSACGGLMNQHYSHISAQVLASALGADVAMPVSLTRDSFENYYSLNPMLNQVKWLPVAQSSVYNIDFLADFIEERGSKLWVVPTDAAVPNFNNQQTAFPEWLPEGFEESQRIKYGNQGASVYVKALPLADLIHDITKVVTRQSRELYTTHKLKYPATILVDLPCSLFSVNLCSPSAEVLSPGVARHLLFAAPLEALAEKVIERIGQRYNGLHLRLEKDAKDWAMMSGGVEVLEKMYWAACENNGFSQNTPLYIASGLLSYNDTSKMDAVRVEVAKFSKSLHYKEMYLSPAELQRFSADQQSAIDFLVLLRSERFVGIGSSTYSWFLREYRNLIGYNEHTSLFVQTPHIGSDPLFNLGARLPKTVRPFRSATYYAREI